MKPLSRRTAIIGATAGAAVLGAIVAVAAFASLPAPAPTPTASAVPTPSPTPTPTPTALPASAPVAGTIDGWTSAAPTVVASVLPQVGDAASGEASAYISAPVIDGEVAALETEIAVEPGKKYDISLQARVESLEPVDVPALIAVAGARVPLPPLNAWWQSAEGTFIADAPTARISVLLSGPVDGLGLDDVVVREHGDESAANVVPNPSFEQVATTARIVNRSLVLPADRAVLAVTGAAGEASWIVTDAAGNEVARGTQQLSGPVAALPLTGVGQGYYTASVTDAAGTTTDTPIALIDMPDGSIPLDARFGVGLHVENDYYADAAHLTASLGAGLARNDILWARNEQARGVYEFQPYYTDGFTALHVNGIHLLGIVNYGNALYGDKNVPSNPDAIAAYGRYAAAIAERFDLAGLEVFNEFNHSRFNKSGCGPAPECYVPLLQTVRDAVHAIDPDLPVVAGSTANYEREWFEGLWRAGGLPLADAVSYHPYQVVYSPEDLGGIIRESRGDMQNLAGDTRPVWITELGMTSTPAGLTLEGQAFFALRATLTALGAGAERYFWYDLINDSTDGTDHEGNFGLFFRARDGVAALPPKPSAYAYALLISQVSGLEKVEEDKTDSGVHSVAFSDERGRSVHAAWAPGGSGEVRFETDSPAEVVSFDGATTTVQPQNGVVSVSVSARPIFVHIAADEPTPSPTPSGTATPER